MSARPPPSPWVRMAGLSFAQIASAIAGTRRCMCSQPGRGGRSSSPGSHLPASFALFSFGGLIVFAG